VGIYFKYKRKRLFRLSAKEESSSYIDLKIAVLVGIEFYQQIDYRYHHKKDEE
jgi:hypothetical protein